jgi:hypothetical protein
MISATRWIAETFKIAIPIRERHRNLMINFKELQVRGGHRSSHAFSSSLIKIIFFFFVDIYTMVGAGCLDPMELFCTRAFWYWVENQVSKRYFPCSNTLPPAFNP